MLKSFCFLQLKKYFWHWKKWYHVEVVWVTWDHCVLESFFKVFLSLTLNPDFDLIRSIKCRAENESITKILICKMLKSSKFIPTIYFHFLAWQHSVIMGKKQACIPDWVNRSAFIYRTTNILSLNFTLRTGKPETNTHWHLNLHWQSACSNWHITSWVIKQAENIRNIYAKRFVVWNECSRVLWSFPERAADTNRAVTCERKFVQNLENGPKQKILHNWTTAF